MQTCLKIFTRQKNYSTKYSILIRDNFLKDCGQHYNLVITAKPLSTYNNTSFRSLTAIRGMSIYSEFQVVVAATLSNGIGKDNQLPWRLKKDMEYFKELTSKTSDIRLNNVVIMGRKTWESIPQKFQPLPNRINIIITRSSSGSVKEDEAKGVYVRPSLDEALSLASSLKDKVEHVFVIGGGQVYADALQHPSCAAIHLTKVELDVECTTFFPEIDPKTFRLWSASKPYTEDSTRFHFLCYTRADRPLGSDLVKLPLATRSAHEEYQYLGLIREVMEEGVLRGDRTGTGTLSVFGRTMTFNLRHGTFPLLTTKRVFWRGVLEELLWFISGSTDANLLKQRKVGIWNGNSCRAYLDSIGLTHREEGDLGPVYGFQWRHFGAKYGTMHDDYRGEGIDQLADIVRRIKANPSDRRLVMTAWNPAALQDMALPPCHMICQFYVANGELSCMMNQRSCDMGLGVPFNIASYALLTRIIAQVCDLVPGDFVHVLGDTHVYCTHVDPLKQQLLNSPRHLPRLAINPLKKDIDSFTVDDFTIELYEPHAPIKMEMAV